jgi:YebC/PmpR family DNA-binding regulatory protein
MSGHSKWHNIKLRKGKADAQRGALFTKISKEIILAAKGGSPDPEANYRLKIAVEKARAANMPQDNIKRAIARATGEGERDIEEIRYEGYGPSGSAVIVEAATDNRNRTAAEMRLIFSRNGGSLGETGSVAWMFDQVGMIEADPGKLDENGLTEAALIDGVIDVRYGHPSEIVTEPAALQSVREALVRGGIRVSDVVLGMEAKTTMNPSADDFAKIFALLEALDDHEDTQRIYSNVELDHTHIEAAT